MSGKILRSLYAEDSKNTRPNSRNEEVPSTTLRRSRNDASEERTGIVKRWQEKFCKIRSLFQARWSAIIRKARKRYLTAERGGSARAESLIARVTVGERWNKPDGGRRRGMAKREREGMKRRRGRGGTKCGGVERLVTGLLPLGEFIDRRVRSG